MKYILYVFICLLALSGCGKNNNIAGSDEEDESQDGTAEQEEVSLAFRSESKSFLPGEIELIEVEGIDLGEEEYYAQTEDSIVVTLLKDIDSDTNELIFIVPEIESGFHKLILKNYDQLNELQFEVKEYEAIEDPNKFVTEIVDSVQTNLNLVLSRIEDESFKGLIRDNLDKLDKAQQDISNLSDEELKILARIIDTNLFSQKNFYSKQKQNFETFAIECQDPLKGLIVDIGFITASLYTLSVSGTVASTGWGALVGGAVAIISSGALYGSLKLFVDDLRTFWDTCIFDSVNAVNTWIMESNEKGLYKNESIQYSFIPREEKAFYLVSEYEAPSDLQGALNELRGMIDSITEIIPDSWRKVLFHEYIVERTEEPSQFSIENISHSNIKGEIQEQDSSVVLTFQYINAESVTGDNEFSFTLSNQEDIEVELEAVLYAPQPKAYNLLYDIPMRGGRTLSLMYDDYNNTFTLDADMATDYEITTQPTKASTLNFRDNEVQYFPQSWFYGQDSLKYIATNNSGKSEEATVNLNVLKNEFSANVDGAGFSALKIYALEYPDDNEVKIGGEKEEYQKGEIKSIYFTIKQPYFKVGSYSMDMGLTEWMCIGFATENGGVQDQTGTNPECISSGSVDENNFGTVTITSIENGIMTGSFSFSLEEDITENSYNVTNGEFKIYLDQYFENQSY